MDWRTYSEKVEEKSKNFKINFPLLENNIYGFFNKKDVLRFFLLVEIIKWTFYLCVIFALGSLFFDIFWIWPETNVFQIVFNVIWVIMPFLIIILSYIIRRKIISIINLFENINWEIFNKNDLYKLRLILTFFWIDEISKQSFMFLFDLRKIMQKKYGKYYLTEDYEKEIMLIFNNIKHKTKEGSVIL